MNFIRDRRRRERQPCLAHPRGADSNRPGFNDYVPSCLLPCLFPPLPSPPVYAFIDVDGSLLNTTVPPLHIFEGNGIKSEVAKINSSRRRRRRRERGVAAIAAAASLLKFDRELGAIKISGINVGRDELLPS